MPPRRNNSYRSKEEKQNKQQQLKQKVPSKSEPDYSTLQEFLTLVATGDIEGIREFVQITCSPSDRPKLINGVIDIPNKRTALHLAAISGDIELVKLLVDEFKADARLQDVEGFTCLHLCCKYSHKYARASKLAENSQLKRSMRASASSLIREANSSSAEVLQHLLFHSNVDAYTESRCGLQAIHIAAREGNNLALQYLIFFGRMNQQVEANQTNKKIVPLLDTQDSAMGNTPLHFAAMTKNGEGFQQLLECNCNYKLKNKAGETALGAHQIRGTSIAAYMQHAKQLAINTTMMMKYNMSHGAAARISKQACDMDEKGKIEEIFANFIALRNAALDKALVVCGTALKQSRITLTYTDVVVKTRSLKLV